MGFSYQSRFGDRSCVYQSLRLPTYNFKNFEYPAGLPVVCFAARLIVEKGVFEFISAAKLLQKKGVRAKFLLAGSIDLQNPSSLNFNDLKKIDFSNNPDYGVEEVSDSTVAMILNFTRQINRYNFLSKSYRSGWQENTLPFIKRSSKTNLINLMTFLHHVGPIVWICLVLMKLL